MGEYWYQVRVTLQVQGELAPEWSTLLQVELEPGKYVEEIGMFCEVFVSLGKPSTSSRQFFVCFGFIALQDTGISVTEEQFT